MNKLLEITVGEILSYPRLDFYLSNHTDCIKLGLSRTKIKNLIEDGNVFVEGRAILDPSFNKINKYKIDIYSRNQISVKLQAENINLDILFEDKHLLVINKPRGMVVHPAPGHSSGTLVNALIAHCGRNLCNFESPNRPGIVHRIDKDTSGLLVVAKDDYTYQGLSKIFMDHGKNFYLNREYIAVVWGIPKTNSGIIKTNYGRNPLNKEKYKVLNSPEKGKLAITHWFLEKSYKFNISKVICRLETGRTHQIRVHMDYIGLNIVNDSIYSKKFLSKQNNLPQQSISVLQKISGQLLHAKTLGFLHPVTNKIVNFTSDIPHDINEFIKTIIQMFEPLILILQRPSKSLLGNANMEIKILEEFRLKIVEFFLGCIESNNADIIKAIIQYHVWPEIINLFFTFENNSMLHNIIEKIIEISIKSFNDNEELLKIILIEGKLLKRLCNGCINKGYSGHLIKIGNELLKISENNEHLANFLSQRKN